jgi:SecD-like export protein
VTHPPPPAPHGAPPPPYVRPPGRGLVVALVAAAVLMLVVVAGGVALFMLSRSDSAGGSGPRAVSVLFLPVTDLTPGACTEGGTPSADGSECYRLGDGMAVTRVLGIRTKGPDGGNPSWRIELELTGSDARTFAELTRRLFAETPGSPRRQLAITVGGKVVSAPEVQSPIPGGRIEIQGGFTRQTAERLVEQITT